MLHPSIEFINFCASWKRTDNEHVSNPVLKIISLRLDRPQVVAVAGPIGAGKSSFLILFGVPLEEARYQEVIQACSLKEDIERYAEGDIDRREREELR